MAIPKAATAAATAGVLPGAAPDMLPSVPVEQTSIAARNNDPNEVTLRFVRWHAHGSTAYQQGEFAGFRRDVAQRLIAGGVAVLAEAAPILESRAVRGHERYADRAMVTK